MDALKRSGLEAGINGNGRGFKKPKTGEMDSTGIGSKSKPCTKFFSTTGCPFGEGCHFAHYVPGGYSAISQISNMGPPAVAPPHGLIAPPPMKNGFGPPAVKSRLCNKFNSAEGCKFGDKCHFAHGEWDIGKPVAPSFDDHYGMGPMSGRGGRMMEPSFPPPSSDFGSSATTKISVDASLAGPIIGKGGVNSKQICSKTGVKLSIGDHETDPNLRNIELEGSFEQISQASAMVRKLIMDVSPMVALPKSRGPPPPPSSNYKTKLCENFGKGSCTFGDRCHFAHGASRLVINATVSTGKNGNFLRSDRKK